MNDAMRHGNARLSIVCGAAVCATTVLLLFSSACMIGPKYQRPAFPVSPAFKEALPAGWKEAQPNDAAPRGKWWSVYNDSRLDALEDQVNISNQNVLAADAQFREAKSSGPHRTRRLVPFCRHGTVGHAFRRGLRSARTLHDTG